MKKAIFYIALPGAGKTTHINAHSNSWVNYRPISADKLKESHPKYDPNNAHLLHQWSVEEAEKIVYATLLEQKSFVFDSGGINNHYSLRILNATKQAGYHITLYFINTPLYECLRRLSLRERKVPVEDVFNKAMKLKSCVVKQKLLVDNFIEIPYYTNQNLVFDMDGTLVEYVAYPLKCDYAPKNVKMDYINNNVFEYAEPVLPMIYKIKHKYSNNNIFILSVSPNSETNKQKLNWLAKYLPFIKEENIYFVGSSEKKIDVLKQLIEKHKLSIKDVTYVDDLHAMIWEGLNSGINSIHPSEFLTEKY